MRKKILFFISIMLLSIVGFLVPAYASGNYDRTVYASSSYSLLAAVQSTSGNYGSTRIVLTEDINLNLYSDLRVDTKNAVMLDLNGHTLTLTHGESITHSGAGDFVIEGNGIYPNNRGKIKINAAWDGTKLSAITSKSKTTISESLTIQNVNIEAAVSNKIRAISLDNANFNMYNSSISGFKFLDGGAAINGSGTLYMYKCEFSNNESGIGGALCIYGNVAIEKSTFENNASEGGGAIYSYCTNLTISECIFKNNKHTGSKWGGGAIFSDMASQDTSINVIDSEFTGNTAVGSGGAIWAYGVIDGCTFRDNKSEKYGTICITRNSSKVIGGSITGNTANAGGAIHSEVDITVSGTKITGNKTNSVGSAITCTRGTVTINSGTIISDNTNPTGGSQVHVNTGILNIKDDNTVVESLGNIKSPIHITGNPTVEMANLADTECFFVVNNEWNNPIRTTVSVSNVALGGKLKVATYPTTTTASSAVRNREYATQNTALGIISENTEVYFTNYPQDVYNYRNTRTNKDYVTLMEAVNAATSGDTIVQLKDVNISTPQTVNKTVTLDLNGYTTTMHSVEGIKHTYGNLVINGNSKNPDARGTIRVYIEDNGYSTAEEAISVTSTGPFFMKNVNMVAEKDNLFRAINAKAGSNVTINNSKLSGFKTESEGSVIFGSGEVYLHECTFENNESTTSIIYTNNTTEIVDCYIYDNATTSSQNWHDGLIRAGSNFSMEGCKIYNNVAYATFFELSGNGIYISANELYENVSKRSIFTTVGGSDYNFSENTIRDNTAGQGIDITNSSSGINISSNTIKGNTWSGHGSIAIYVVGTIPTVIEGNTFTSNYGNYARDIYTQSGTNKTTIIQNTFNDFDSSSKQSVVRAESTIEFIDNTINCTNYTSKGVIYNSADNSIIRGGKFINPTPLNTSGFDIVTTKPLKVEGTINPNKVLLNSSEAYLIATSTTYPWTSSTSTTVVIPTLATGAKFKIATYANQTDASNAVAKGKFTTVVSTYSIMSEGESVYITLNPELVYNYKNITRDTYYMTLGEAVSASTTVSGDNIVQLKDVIVTSTQQVSKPVTVDLGGYTLTIRVANGIKPYSSGNLVINGNVSNSSNRGKIIVDVSAASSLAAIESSANSLTIQNVDIEASTTNKIRGVVNRGELNIYTSSISKFNTSYNGSAVSNHGTLEISECNFKYNTSVGAGGAVYSAGDAGVYNSNFIQNTTNNIGGSIYAGSNLNVGNCKFENNIAKAGGGAIYAVQDESLTSYISASTFTGNKTSKNGDTSISANGSAIYGHGTIYNSTFSNNAAEDYGTVVLMNCDSEITNSTISNNTALAGGALHGNANVVISNTKITGNQTTDVGPAISYYDGDITIKNGSNISGNGNSGSSQVHSKNNTLSIQGDTTNVESIGVKNAPIKITNNPTVGAANLTDENSYFICSSDWITNNPTTVRVPKFDSKDRVRIGNYPSEALATNAIRVNKYTLNEPEYSVISEGANVYIVYAPKESANYHNLTRDTYHMSINNVDALASTGDKVEQLNDVTVDKPQKITKRWSLDGSDYITTWQQNVTITASGTQPFSIENSIWKFDPKYKIDGTVAYIGSNNFTMSNLEFRGVGDWSLNTLMHIKATQVNLADISVLDFSNENNNLLFYLDQGSTINMSYANISNNKGLTIVSNNVDLDISNSNFTNNEDINVLADATVIIRGTNFNNYTTNYIVNNFGSIDIEHCTVDTFKGVDVFLNQSSGTLNIGYGTRIRNIAGGIVDNFGSMYVNSDADDKNYISNVSESLFINHGDLFIQNTDISGVSNGHVVYNENSAKVNIDLVSIKDSQLSSAIANKGTATLDSVIVGNCGSVSPLLINETNSTLNIYYSNISKNNVSNHIVYNKGTMIVENSNTDYNTVPSGASIFDLGNASQNTFKSISACNNTSSNLGYVIYIAPDLTDTFKCDFTGTDSSDVNGSSLTTTNYSKISNNTKMYRIIYLPRSSKGTINFSNLIVESNTNTDNGVIALSGLDNINFNHVVIRNNTSTRTGCGFMLYGVKSKVTFSNSLYYGNSGRIDIAPSGSNIVNTSINKSDFINNTQGVISITSTNSNIEVKNSLFNGNKGTNGSALGIAGSAIISNNQFTNNSATGNGGAISTGNIGSSTRTVTISTNTFSGNSAANGGAVYSNTSIKNFSGNKFNTNTATKSGGAIYTTAADKFSNDTFTGNKATTSGGAIYSTSSGTTINNVDFVGNSATDGGAIKGTASVSVSRFTSNKATSYGGAISSSGSTLNGNTYTQNTSKVGAAIYTYGTNTTTDTASTYKSNEGTLSVIYFNSPAEISDCLINDNATTSQQAWHTGLVRAVSNFHMEGCEVNNNVAYATFFELMGNDIYISDNELYSNASNRSIFTTLGGNGYYLSGNTIRNNTAAQGIDITNSSNTVDIRTNTINNNSWSANGSIAGYVIGTTPAVVEGNTFTSNTGYNVGDIYLQSGKMTVRNNTFNSSKATRGTSVIKAESTVELIDNTINCSNYSTSGLVYNSGTDSIIRGGKFVTPTPYTTSGFDIVTTKPLKVEGTVNPNKVLLSTSEAYLKATNTTYPWADSYKVHMTVYGNLKDRIIAEYPTSAKATSSVKSRKWIMWNNTYAPYDDGIYVKLDESGIQNVDTGQYYTNLYYATRDCNVGDHLVVCDSYVDDKAFYVTKNAYLDLGGHTIYMYADGGNDAFGYFSANMPISNGSIKVWTANNTWTNYGVFSGRNNGTEYNTTWTLNKVKVDNTVANPTEYVRNYHRLWSSYTTSNNVYTYTNRNDVTIYPTSTLIYGGSKVNITDSTFNSTHKASHVGYITTNNSTNINISGSSFDIDNAKHIISSNNPTIVSVDNDYIIDYANTTGEDAVFKLTGGTINSTEDTAKVGTVGTKRGLFINSTSTNATIANIRLTADHMSVMKGKSAIVQRCDISPMNSSYAFSLTGKLTSSNNYYSSRGNTDSSVKVDYLISADLGIDSNTDYMGGLYTTSDNSLLKSTNGSISMINGSYIGQSSASTIVETGLNFSMDKSTVTNSAATNNLVAADGNVLMNNSANIMSSIANNGNLIKAAAPVSLDTKSTVISNHAAKDLINSTNGAVNMSNGAYMMSNTSNANLIKAAKDSKFSNASLVSNTVLGQLVGVTGNVNFTGGTLTQNTASSDVINASGDVTISGVNFVYNTAGNRGVYSPNAVTVNNASDVVSNKTANQLIVATTANVNNVDLAVNNAKGLIETSGNTTIANSAIASNTITGDMIKTGSGSVDISSNTVINSNTGNGYIAVSTTGAIDIVDSDIISNTFANGILRSNGNVSVTLDNVTHTGNTSNGDSIYASSGEVNIVSSGIENNKSVYANLIGASNGVTIDTTNVESNSASHAIVWEGSRDIHSTNSSYTNNTSKSYIIVTSSSSIYLNSDTLANNESNYSTLKVARDLEISDTVIDSNICNDSIMALHGDTFIIDNNSVIVNNEFTRCLVEVFSDGNLTIDNSSINNNTYMADTTHISFSLIRANYGNLLVSDSLMERNYHPNSLIYLPGAVNTSMDINNSVFVNNQSNIVIEGCGNLKAYNISNSTIESNNVKETVICSEDGIYSTDRGTNVNVTNTSLISNTSNGNLVTIDSSNSNWTNCTIKSNTYATSGITLTREDTASTQTFTDCTISNNVSKSTKGYGAIAVTDADYASATKPVISIQGNTIVENNTSGLSYATVDMSKLRYNKRIDSYWYGAVAYDEASKKFVNTGNRGMFGPTTLPTVATKSADISLAYNDTASIQDNARVGSIHLDNARVNSESHIVVPSKKWLDTHVTNIVLESSTAGYYEGRVIAKYSDVDNLRHHYEGDYPDGSFYGHKYSLNNPNWTTVPTNDNTMVLAKQYSIKFAPGTTGVTNMPDTIWRVTHNTIQMLPNITPTRADYEFNGWLCSLDNKTYWPGDYHKFTNNCTMTAQWKPKEGATSLYYVKYRAFNVLREDSALPYSTYNLPSGSKYTIPDNPWPSTADNRLLSHYEYETNGNIVSVFPGDTITVTRDTILVAVFEREASEYPPTPTLSEDHPEYVAYNTNTSKYYFTLRTAVQEARDGDTITMLADDATEGVLTIDKSLIITTSDIKERLGVAYSEIKISAGKEVQFANMLDISSKITSYGIININGSLVHNIYLDASNTNSYIIATGIPTRVTPIVVSHIGTNKFNLDAPYKKAIVSPAGATNQTIRNFQLAKGIDDLVFTIRDNTDVYLMNFTIKFDYVYDDVTNNSTKEIKHLIPPDKVTLPSNPTKLGYVFEGWEYNGAILPTDFTFTGYEDMTLKAVWRFNVQGRFSITYDWNGRKPANAPADTLDIIPGSAVTIKCPSKQATNYVATYVLYKGETPIVNPFTSDKSITAIDDNYIVKATWRLDINNNGIPDEEEYGWITLQSPRSLAGVITAEELINKYNYLDCKVNGSTISIKVLPNFSCGTFPYIEFSDGYIGSWKSGSKVYSSTENVPAWNGSSTTYTGIFTSNVTTTYSITFDGLNGAVNTPQSVAGITPGSHVQVILGTKISGSGNTINVLEPAKDDYEFLGWVSNVDFGYGKGTASNPLKPTNGWYDIPNYNYGDIKLTAVWKYIGEDIDVDDPFHPSGSSRG